MLHLLPLLMDLNIKAHKKTLVLDFWDLLEFLRKDLEELFHINSYISGLSSSRRLATDGCSVGTLEPR